MREKTEHQLRVSDIVNARRAARNRKLKDAAIVLTIFSLIAFCVWLGLRR